MAIDPQTGLPVDDSGQLLDASAAGSNVISDSDPGGFTTTATPPAPSTPSTHPAADIPMPGEQQPQLKSISGSYQGISEPQLKTVSKLQTGADKRADADLQRFAPEYNAIGQAFDQNSRAQKQALQMETQARQEHSRREVELYRAQQSFISEQADLEKQAFAHSQIVKQQYLNNYEHDLLTARMLAMQSGDPNETMGGAGAIGLMAQAAVQGFLKVGGINLDVTSATERWINREIAKHSEMVANANQQAQGQLHLYELARQKSTDEYEARERYRGMVLEGLKSQVAMEAAKFGSSLASAAAAQKAAEIDSQLLTVKTNLADKKAKMYYDFENMRIQQAHYMAQDSVAREQLKLERDKLDAKKKAEEAATLKIPDPGRTIRDKDGKVTAVQNGWQLKPGAPDGVQTKVMEMGKQYAQIIPAVQKLTNLRNPAMDGFIAKYGPGKALASEEYRAYEREKRLAIMGVRHAIAGANLTKEEKAEWDSLLENDSGWQSGGNFSALSQLEKKYRDDFVAEMDQNPWLTKIDNEKDIREVGTGSNDTDAKYNAEFGSKAATTTPVNNAVSDATRVGHNEVQREGFSPLYQRYMQSTGDSAGAGTTDNRESTPGQRAEIDAVDHLAAIVAKPQLAVDATTVDGQSTTDPQTAVQEAHGALQKLAAGTSPTGKPVDPEVQRYATFVLQEMGSTQDAESFYSQVASRTYEAGLGSPAEQLTSGDYQRNMQQRKTQERAEFLRKGITGQ